MIYFYQQLPLVFYREIIQINNFIIGERSFMKEREISLEDKHKEDIKFSIIIPAHNEEKYIGKCLESISKASKAFENQVEVIVVLNRCTDRTEEIAKSYKCITIKNNDKNLSKIRNAGADIAKGEIIVTIDADTQMNDHVLSSVEEYLTTGKYIGGGVTGKFERMSFGIFVSTLLLIGPLLLKYGAISVLLMKYNYLITQRVRAPLKEFAFFFFCWGRSV